MEMENLSFSSYQYCKFCLGTGILKEFFMKFKKEWKDVLRSVLKFMNYLNA